MNPVDIVAVLAVIQFMFFGALVGRARDRYGVKAPAVSGHEMFDRAFRVQMNTLEQLVCFLPALLIAGRYWAPWVVAAIGFVYLVGRLIYWRAYTREPRSRAIGFVLTIAPTAGLLAMAGIGALVRGTV